MPRKPPACQGCPFYETSKEWTPDVIREGAKVMLVSDQPWQGKSGQGVNYALWLRDAGLSEDEVSIGHALRCRWRNTNDLPKYTERVVKDAIEHCTSAHFYPAPETRLYVALGDYAAIQLVGEPVGEWRGYLRPLHARQSPPAVEPWVPHDQDRSVLVCHNLATLPRDPNRIMAAHADWSKVSRILAKKWPRQPPAYGDRAPSPWPRAFSFDTEFPHDQPRHLIRYSMAWGTNDYESCVVERGDHKWQTLGYQPRVITQYAPADMRHLDWLTSQRRGDGLSDSFWSSFVIEDAVWKHAVLWSDQPHDLNYLASIYSSFNRWKHLSAVNPRLYSALDAIGLWEVDLALERELSADPRSRRVWETIDRPALGEFVRAQYRGIRTDPQRLGQAMEALGEAARDATRRARALAGWPINLGSNTQVAHRLYQIEGIKAPR